MITFSPTIKQHETFQYLQDDRTHSVLFGGGVGGGKSYLIASYLIISCFRYPGSRHLLGRSRLSVLRRTTVKTIQDLILKWGLLDYVQFNSQTNTYTFTNGSEILLMDLFPYPADSDFDRLGSLEISSVCIDELSEISYKAFEVLKTRIRYKLDDFHIIPKILCCSNPTRSWVQNYFIKTPSPDTKFVQCLASDNPHLPQSYISSLQGLNISLKERLLYGNWDYMDSDFELFQYEPLLNTFYNEGFKNTSEETFLTVDVGDVGSDKSFIGVWKGWNCIQKVILEKTETSGVVNKCKELIGTYKIRITNVIVDSVGVGAGVASYLKGCIRYYGNGACLNGEKFTNIKSQLMYKYAEKVNNYEVNYNFEYDDKMIQEHLAYCKTIKEDKFGITPKEQVKQKLGRSPDSIDSLYLRAYFEYKKPVVLGWSKINTSN